MASRKGGGGSGGGGGTGGGGGAGGGGGTGGGGGQRTLEMRVAELEDRISKLSGGGAQGTAACVIYCIAGMAQQGTGGAEGGAEGETSEGEARPCMAAGTKPCIAAGPTPCTIRPIYQQCVIYHCVIRCFITHCINECGGGCLPCAAGGGGGSFGGFGF